MPDDLRTRVEHTLSELSPAGRHVALLLLDEHDRLGFHSATDLARMAGTSDATVIRTVQRLGYTGMIDLKTQVVRQLTPPTPAQRLDAAILDPNPGDDHLAAIHETQLRALTRLQQPDLRAQILRASTKLSDARRVHVNARGISVGLADYTAAQLARVGIDARRLGSAAGVVADDLVAIAPHDMVIVMSTGERKRWHETLYDRCASVGAGIVLITDTHPAPTDDSIVIRAGRGDPTGTATHVATVATIESIALTLAAQNRHRAETTLEQLAHHRELLAR